MPPIAPRKNTRELSDINRLVVDDGSEKNIILIWRSLINELKYSRGVGTRGDGKGL